MRFSHNIEGVVQVVEAAGVAVLVVGGLLAFLHSSMLHLVPTRRANAYHYFRKHLGPRHLAGLVDGIADRPDEPVDRTWAGPGPP
jgi:hypothetical protein